MGFYISKLKDSQLGEYIGSQTIYSIADKGAFDGEVSGDLQEYCNNHENVIAIVDESHVDHFLNIIKNDSVGGRDIQTLISEVESKYMDGFMIVR